MSLYRITFVDSIRSWGGAEVWLLETVAALRDAGVAADLVAQPGSELLRRARKADIPCAAIPIRFDAAPWTLAKLVRHFRGRGTTAIWANMTKDLKATSVAGRLAGVPVILGSRESDFPLKSKPYYKWYFNRLATGLLVNSEATRRTALESAPWLDPARVQLLYKGIDTNRFSPAPGPPAVPTVGFVGQLIRRKGLAALMDAWTSIDSSSGPDGPVLRLAGEGYLAPDILAWRATLRHPARVEVPGFVEDIATFIRGLTVLVMPSLAEGFGLAAAEASACEVPVIAADASSLPEIVRHEETGLLIPTRDPEALVDAINRLLADPELARCLGRAGRARIRDKFTRAATLRRLLELTGGPADLIPEEVSP